MRYTVPDDPTDSFMQRSCGAIACDFTIEYGRLIHVEFWIGTEVGVESRHISRLSSQVPVILSRTHIHDCALLFACLPSYDFRCGLETSFDVVNEKI